MPGSTQQCKQPIDEVAAVGAEGLIQGCQLTTEVLGSASGNHRPRGAASHLGKGLEHKCQVDVNVKGRQRSIRGPSIGFRSTLVWVPWRDNYGCGVGIIARHQDRGHRIEVVQLVVRCLMKQGLGQDYRIVEDVVTKEDRSWDALQRSALEDVLAGNEGQQLNMRQRISDEARADALDDLNRPVQSAGHVCIDRDHLDS